ncbi:MAG TPA: glycosyltransferase family 4 protein, partial [Spirochaetota bacterium]|nr:glycosyltransferase family 4 protein [Spirochaetota bacterium]
MNILHVVESYYPFKSGMAEVVKQISENLVSFGYSVTVATTICDERRSNALNGVKIISFDITGNAVTGISGKESEKQRYFDLIKNQNFDLVTFFAAQQWGTDIVLPFLNEIKAKKIFVPTGFSGLNIPEYKKYFEDMRLYIKNFDHNIFLSNDYRDINFARENNIDERKISVVPNGASENEFLSPSNNEIRKKLNIPPEDFLILSVGSHTALKGHKESIEIFKRLKIKNAVLVIVGNKIENVKIKINFKNIVKMLLFYVFGKNFGKGCEFYCNYMNKKFKASFLRLFDKKKLIITDLSRGDTVNLYKSSDLFLFPSKIECSPIVLFESCASKTPFLVTSVGNSSEIIDLTGGGELLPTKKDKKGYSAAIINKSVKVVENLIKDEGKRKRLGEKGFENWQLNFTWEKISKKYEEIYLRTLVLNFFTGNKTKNDETTE